MTFAGVSNMDIYQNQNKSSLESSWCLLSSSFKIITWTFACVCKMKNTEDT